MKRAFIGVALIATGFGLGFYSAHLPNTSPKDIPSIELKKRLSAVDFLESELMKEMAEYEKAPTPEHRKRIEDLRRTTGLNAISALRELRKSQL